MRKRFVNLIGPCLSAAVLAACGSPAPISVAPHVTVPESVVAGSASHRIAFTHLFTFDGADGAEPQAGLTAVKGVLYGTTIRGGAGRNTGTVFKITTSGMETVLHSFGSFYYDPVYPDAGLTDVNGKLYGTTEGGGGNISGTIFKITTSGTEKQIYSFQSGSDGRYPTADLVADNGTLYGVTWSGGIPSCGASGRGCGTVFSVTTSGTETVLHRFAAAPDGAEPLGALLPVNGTLYGTTAAGGTGSCNSIEGGCGTVFTIAPSGAETVLYNFQGGADGEFPQSGLIAVNGTLYGTTTDGGGSGCGGYGCGTVFEIGTSGTETVLHTFQSGTDGALPYAGLIAMNGTLYGTTSEGGGSGCGGSGCGTVFQINASGAESVLYSFKGKRDGRIPEAGLVALDGRLYGTTSRGGGGNACRHGCGTVFALTPNPDSSPDR